MKHDKMYVLQALDVKEITAFTVARKCQSKSKRQCKTLVSCLCAFSLTLLGYHIDGLIYASIYIIINILFYIILK